MDFSRPSHRSLATRDTGEAPEPEPADAVSAPSRAAEVPMEASECADVQSLADMFLGVK